MIPPSLKERFESFMSSGDFAESIDAGAKSHYPKGFQRADYLARNRSAIIEQKSLDQDVDAKVQAFLGDLVPAYGPLDREQLTLAGIIDAVAQLPPGNPFKPRLRAILTQESMTYLPRPTSKRGIRGSFSGSRMRSASLSS
jgi:hypothetical protein